MTDDYRNPRYDYRRPESFAPNPFRVSPPRGARRERGMSPIAIRGLPSSEFRSYSRSPPRGGSSPSPPLRYGGMRGSFGLTGARPAEFFERSAVDQSSLRSVGQTNPLFGVERAVAPALNPVAGPSSGDSSMDPSKGRLTRWDLEENPKRREEPGSVAAATARPAQLPSPGSSSTTTHLTPFDVHEAVIKEYVDHESGVMEIRVPPQGVAMSCFFHMDTLWIPNRYGNPYGPPVPYVSAAAAPLSQDLPIGSVVRVRAVNAVSGSQRVVHAFALMVWTRMTDDPPEQSAKGYIEMEKGQMAHFELFTQNRIDVSRLIEASLHWPNPDDVVASVCELKSAEFGIIEINFIHGANQKFYCFFHKRSIWLRDGKRGVEVEYFREKPLSFMMSVGQRVNLSARSILNRKGKDMRPVALEFQAVAVSLDPASTPGECPRPTRCGFGPGEFGSDSNGTLFYLEPTLFDRLNQEFTDFVNFTDLHLLPEIDPMCKVVKAKSDQSQMQASGITVPTHDMSGNVVKIFNEYFGLVKLDDDKGFVLADVGVAMLIKKEPFFDAFPLGSVVGVHGRLMDANQPIKYVATLIWKPNLFSQDQVEGRNMSIDDPQVKAAYERSNRDFPLFSDELRVLPASGSVLDYPPQQDSARREIGDSSVHGVARREAQGPQQNYVAADGRVFKVLDANFALIQSETDARHLVLFDSCDIWLTPKRTAEKCGKKLEEFVKVGLAVKFHAVFQGESEIPYLATSVWFDDGEFRSSANVPATISSDKIHGDKLKIYRTVVASVGPTLRQAQKPKDCSSSEGASASRGGRQTDRSSDQLGTIRALYQRKGEAIGGVIELNCSRKFAFFTERSIVKSTFQKPLHVGCQVKVNAVGVSGSDTPWADRVRSVAVSVWDETHAGRVLTREETDGLLKRSIADVNRLLELKPYCLDSVSLSVPVYPVVEFDEEETGRKQLRPIADCNSACIKCMIDDSHGILEDNENPNCLCWFSLSDLNFTSPISVEDSVMVLNRMHGITVRFQARLVNETGAVQYVAHEKGVQVVGKLPSFMKHLKMAPATKSRTVTTLKNKRMNGFWDAVQNYNKGNYRKVSDILRHGEGTAPTSRSPKIGVVRHILNDNFGVVYDGDGFGLFDTFDVYLNGSKNAAEEGKSIKDLLTVGSKVFYQAVLVDRANALPYLCTGLWTDKKFEMEPLSLDRIQEEKLTIYKQVSSSCAALVKRLAEEEAAKDKLPVEKPNFASGVRREQMERCYNSPAYKEYLRQVPKHSRQARDPQTPDRNQQISASEFTEKIRAWQYEIHGRYYDKHATVQSTDSSRRGKSCVADLHEQFVTGVFSREIDSKFAVLRLSNGRNALVSRRRIWSYGNEFRGSWRSLQSTVNVRARAIHGNLDFEYQVIFCHHGYNAKDATNRKFIYQGRIHDWIEVIDDEELLNQELQAVENLTY